MCGIAGIVGQGWSRRDLEAMIEIQSHRGPDDDGSFVNSNGEVGLGHNRLSIIDVTTAGHQPMFGRNDQTCIVFNGEIYNYLELKKGLADYEFRSRTDTEVILAAYERWGVGCVERLIGMFAFAIWDGAKQRLYCARDRLGIKPFHYTRSPDRFMFASEIKALLAAGARFVPNRATWAYYLLYGICDHSTDTFFEGVHSLPAGHYLLLEAGKLKIQEYWSLANAADSQLDIDDCEAAEQWMELFRESVRLRLRSDVPLGINLSGGLDSASLLVTVDQELGDEGRLETFTASFDDPKYDESEFSSQVPVSRIIERNIARVASEQVWRMLEEVSWHQEAPFGGVATIAYHSLHRRAQQKGIKVLLEGQGVDEMLAGYGYFRPYFHCDLLSEGSFGELRRELRADSNDWHKAAKTLRSLPPDDQFGVYQDGTTFLQPQCIAREINDSAPEPPKIPAPFSSRLQNALFRDIRYTKLPRVLRMNDRLSMAFGRELREPYLDHRLVELSFRLSGSKKIRNGKGKYLLRHAMANHLPAKVCWAPKRSVVTPQREWLTRLLREQVMEIIGSRSFAERGLFNAEEVIKTYRRLCDSGVSNTFAIWQWVNTELWFRFADSGWKFAKSETCHWR